MWIVHQISPCLYLHVWRGPQFGANTSEISSRCLKVDLCFVYLRIYLDQIMFQFELYRLAQSAIEKEKQHSMFCFMLKDYVVSK